MTDSHPLPRLHPFVPPAGVDRMREECGVVGIAGAPEASKVAYLALYALQHRGQESAGIVSRQGEEMFVHRDMGLVADIFSEPKLARLPGRHAIGHVRYSTSGHSALADAQPFFATSGKLRIAIAHNGNLTNAGAIREELESHGSIFQSTMDTEVIVHLIARSRGSFEERVSDALSRLRGAYSLVLQTENALVAVRDPHGFRPLSLGRLGSGWVVSSETCAFDLIGATFERDIAPGEVICIRRGRLRSFDPLPAVPERFCVFEHVYFARPDSVVFGSNVYQVRKELGRALARKCPADADIVVPVLDSGLAAALGFSEEAGIPFETAIIRNHFVRRTFIEPEQQIRLFGVRIKHNAIRAVVEGKRVVVVEDSIVRGTTLSKLVPLIRAAGAREVHVRVAAPPTIGPCFYGIDTPSRGELVSANQSVSDVQAAIGADSLVYLPLEALRGVASGMKHGFCDACFSGEYPVQVDPVTPGDQQLQLFERRAQSTETGD